MHTITECRAEDNYTLWLRFNDGLEGHVYLGDLVHTQYFRMLCDIDTFNRVEVDPVENTVTWEGGIKLDPEKLYQIWPAKPSRLCTRAGCAARGLAPRAVIALRRPSGRQLVWFRQRKRRPRPTTVLCVLTLNRRAGDG